MASYHFIGGDDRRYGPYDANQMRKFLAENRLTGQSRVSIDGGIMRPAAEFPEIMGGSPAGMAAGPPSMMTPQVHPESVIKGPTLGLIISSGIGVFGLIALTIHEISDGEVSRLETKEGEAFMIVFIGVRVLMVCCLAFIIVGAIMMRQFRNRGVSMAAAIVACVPFCSPCVVLGIPFGIWALVVMAKPEVRAAFQPRPFR